MNLKLGAIEASLASCDKVIATWVRYEKYVLVLNIHKVTTVFSLFFANCTNATTRNSLSFITKFLIARRECAPTFYTLGFAIITRNYYTKLCTLYNTLITVSRFISKASTVLMASAVRTLMPRSLRY